MRKAIKLNIWRTIMNNSARFFANKDCEHYPCHKGIEEMNCLFCYCPQYTREKCPGNYVMLEETDGEIVKDCSSCLFPHLPENYDKIIDILKETNI